MLNIMPLLSVCFSIPFELWTRFWTALKQNAKERLKYITTFVLLWVIATEIVAYTVWPLFWPRLRNRTPDTVNILLVGDPQLLGYKNTMPGIFGFFARWDSDRFLKNTHHLANNYIKPHVTLFLGDNFDEGEIATDAEFDDYFQRFLIVFHEVNFSNAIIVAGDNDIGGEHSPPIKSYADRFNRYFKVGGFTQHKFVEFFKYNAMTRKKMYKHPFPRSKNIRLLLSHIPMMPTMGPAAKRVIEELFPHLIISAHEHISIYMSVDPKLMELRSLRQAFAEDFEAKEINLTDGNVHEILIPASSYRMGTQKIGYGALLIEPSGLVSYTVLWLPSRLKQLYSYIVLGGFVFLMICPGFSRLFVKLMPRNTFLKQR